MNKTNSMPKKPVFGRVEKWNPRILKAIHMRKIVVGYEDSKAKKGFVICYFDRDNWEPVSFHSMNGEGLCDPDSPRQIISVGGKIK